MTQDAAALAARISESVFEGLVNGTAPVLVPVPACGGPAAGYEAWDPVFPAHYGLDPVSELAYLRQRDGAVCGVRIEAFSWAVPLRRLRLLR